MQELWALCMQALAAATLVQVCSKHLGINYKASRVQAICEPMGGAAFEAAVFLTGLESLDEERPDLAMQLRGPRGLRHVAAVAITSADPCDRVQLQIVSVRD